jgi:phosphate acetyltransferase
VRIAIDQLREHRCELLAAIVNHVSPERLASLTAELRNDQLPCPVITLPNEPSLDKPTLREIASALEATQLAGDEAGLASDVQSFIVAAMQLPHFLEHLRAGSLVITPGDRADILVGGLASLASRTLPNIAGFVLTGALTPSPQVMKLVNGLPTVPILAVETDTFETATKAAAVPAVLRPENERKIASALGLFETHVDLHELEARIAAPRQAKLTPLMFEYELLRRARSQPRRIVLPEGTEPRILRAVDVLRRRRVVEVILLGADREIRQTAGSLGINLDEVEILDPTDSSLLAEFARTYFEMRKHKGITEEAALDRMKDVSYFGTMMVAQGLADGMVSGSIHTTAHTIRPAFEFIKTKPGTGIVSSVFFMCLPDRVLVYGDCAINPDPTAAQLAEIAISSAATAAEFGIEPRVALLSYSTGESGTGAEVDKVREATLLARRLRPDLKIEGPIQYDAAVDPDVAKTKLASSDVAGRATVLVFPDLNSGNNAYKAVQRSSGAIAIGPVLQGLRKPVNDLSRGCTVPDIVNTVAITAIQAQSMVERES